MGTVTIKVLAAEVGAEVEKLESKEFRKATGCKFQQFKPSHGSVICATCKWDGHHIKVTTTSTPKSMARRASSTSATTRAVFANVFASRLRTDPYSSCSFLSKLVV